MADAFWRSIAERVATTLLPSAAVYFGAVELRKGLKECGEALKSGLRGLMSQRDGPAPHVYVHVDQDGKKR